MVRRWAHLSLSDSFVDNRGESNGMLISYSPKRTPQCANRHRVDGSGQVERAHCVLVECLLSDRELRIQGMRMKHWLLSIRCLPRPSAPRGFYSTIVSIPLDD